MEQRAKDGQPAQPAAAGTSEARQRIEAFLRCSARYLGLVLPVAVEAAGESRAQSDE
ncbi:MAG: hypothetical protein WCC36_00780 [Gammaproteobacteria bacterium]